MEPSDIDENLILKFNTDPYKGAIFIDDLYPNDPNEFEKMMSSTLKILTHKKTRGVWLKININQSELISIAVKYGFIYHHAKPTYVMMIRWLPKNELNKLPHFASHYIGVGGNIIILGKYNHGINTKALFQIRLRKKFQQFKKEYFINKANKILLNTINRDELDIWKVPGGLLDEGEFLADAVERECYMQIKEETGVQVKFHSIVSFREKKKYRFGQPDIYFLTLCNPITFEIDHDPQEIKKAAWMPIKEFLNLPVEFEFQRKVHIIIKALGKLLDQYSTDIFEVSDVKSELGLEYIGFKCFPYKSPYFGSDVQPIDSNPDNMMYFSKFAELIQQKNTPKLQIDDIIYNFVNAQTRNKANILPI